MASPATQDVCARPKAAAHTGCGIQYSDNQWKTNLTVPVSFPGLPLQFF
ncbi:MAG: hypothetical protein FWC50_10525 [Planctomycetaceae bacterium]|nr:hypothetical protein [Planctomycetaceae bacterium]